MPILTNLRDSWVNENRANKNFSNAARLKMAASGAGATKYAYIFAGRPFELGTTLLTGKLRLWNSKAMTGTVTVTVERITEKWAASRVTWNNKPTVGATQYTLQKTDAAADTMWEIDILPMLQFISNGGSWYGVRVSVSGTTTQVFHSSQSEESDFRPQLVAAWAEAPEPPENPSPDNNSAVPMSHPLLSMDFIDLAGDTTLQALQVQIDDASDFATPTFDSGWVTPTDGEAEYDTASGAFAGLADGQSVYWRARVRDGAGVESSWMEDPAQMRRVNKTSLTLNGLGSKLVGGQTRYYVEETSPTLSWTLGAPRTQTAYSLTVAPEDDLDKPTFETGKVTATTNSITTSDKTFRKKDTPYRVTLRVWDDILDRVKNKNDNPYYEVVQTVYYDPTTVVTAPTGVTPTPAYPWPWVDVVFNRTTSPDSFAVFRDGELVEDNIVPGDIFVSGTQYSYRDKVVGPRVSHTWEVVANVNGVDSQPASGSATTNTGFTWMMRPDGSDPIVLTRSGAPGPVIEASSRSFQEVHTPVGGDSPVLITQFISGFEGRVEAVLADNIVDGLSARTMKARLKKYRKNLGQEILLVGVDETLRVVPYNITYRPRAKGNTVIYDISFDFFEVGNS